MKSTLITSLLVSLIAVASYAADQEKEGTGQKQSVEQKKAKIIQHINGRISNSQAEIACVKEASTNDALRACREKYRPQRPNDERQGHKEPPRED